MIREDFLGRPDGLVLDAIVVGAGISGLVAAHRLQRAGLQVGVVDAGTQPGGVIASVARDGFRYECGPNSALDTTPLIGELVEDLGLQSQWRFASAASDKRYVVRGGVLTALPMSPAAFLTTPLFSMSAKLALMREPFLKASDPAMEESIADFVRRRLGREFLDYAIDPFVAGVYAGDPEQISVRAAFPKLHALEQRWGSLIRGQMLGARERRRTKETAKNTAKSFSFVGGMQQLTDTLAAGLPRLALGARATALARGADGVFALQVAGAPGTPLWRARSLVLAVPADAAAALLRERVPDAAAALRSIAYAPVASVASGYARSALRHALDGFGCLVPRKEQRRVLGVLFSSTMYEQRAEPGSALLTSFIGGLRQPELAALPDDQIAALVQAEHRALLGAQADARFHAVMRWPRAIPQYTLGHGERVARAQAAERELPGLYFCANWKGGVSVGDCIRNGFEVAESARAYLGTAA